MSAAIAPIAPRLGKLIPRLASDHDGEIVATVRAMDRALKGSGFDWHDLSAALLSSPDPVRNDARMAVPDILKALLNSDRLSGWERKFCSDVARLVWAGKVLTPYQVSKVGEIYEQRCGGVA